MTRSSKQFIEFLKSKYIKIPDIILVVLFLICILYFMENSYRFDFDVDNEFELIHPWMAVQDNQENSYIIDKERSRVVKLNQENEVDFVIDGYAPDGNTFYYADSITVSKDGDIYILDTEWSEKGFSVISESILRYNSSGDFEEIYYQVFYDKIYNDKHRIFGMRAIEDDLFFVSADEDGFQLNCIDGVTGEVHVKQDYSLKDAIILIQDFTIQEKTLEIYGTDKRGKIIKGDIQGNIETIYDSLIDPMFPEKSTFYRLDVSPEHIIYITDIALDRVLALDTKEDNKQLYEIITGSKNWTVTVNKVGPDIYLNAAGNNGVIIDNLEGKRVLNQLIFKNGFNYQMKKILFVLASLIGAISLVYMLLRVIGIVANIEYLSSQRIGMLLMSVLIFVALIVVSNLTKEHEKIYSDELMFKLTTAAEAVSYSIDKDALENVVFPKHFMNEDYKKLIGVINNTIDKSHNYNDDLYCNIMKYDGQEAYSLIYQDMSIGAYYPLLENEVSDVLYIYETGNKIHSNVTSETGSYIYVEMPIYNEAHNKVIGVVAVGTLNNNLLTNMKAIVRWLLIVSVLIIVIVLFMFTERVAFIKLRAKFYEETEKKHKTPFHIARLLIFITFIGVSMATSFMPIYVSSFVTADFGISKELVAAIPISINLVFIGLTAPFCSGLLQKMGFKYVAMLSAFLSMSGDILMAIGGSYLTLLLGLIINGIGVGLITNEIYNYIILYDHEVKKNKRKSTGVSIFNGASLAGINVGMIIGAFLANRIGQQNVFIVSAILWAFLIVSFVIVGKYTIKMNSLRFSYKSSGISNNSNKSSNSKRWVFTRNMLTFIFLIQIPYIMINGFIYYYIPLFGDANGLNELEISLLIIISSLCSVYLSVPLTSYLKEKMKGKTLYLSSLIAYIGLLVFALNRNVTALVVASVLIGIGNSFGISERFSYFLSFEELKVYNKRKSIKVYNLLNTMGEFAGPIVFAGIMSSGMLLGTLTFVGVSAGLNGIFALKEKNKRQLAIK